MKHYLGTALALCLVSSVARADDVTGDFANDLEIQDFATGIDSPTSFTWLPDGRMLVNSKGGTVFIVEADGSSKAEAGKFDVAANDEKGLLNVVLHPDFANNKTLFFYVSRSGNINEVVKTTLDNDQIDTGGAQRILANPAHDKYHNGSGLNLSADGKYLYVSVGDRKTSALAQCFTSGNGKILRVAVDGSIPDDNPLASLDDITACDGDDASDVRKDIFAWGFRNPFRFTVDKKNGNLWVADVGENTREEIDILPKSGGLNFGWPHTEGTLGDTGDCKGTSPDVGNCVEPVYDYATADGGDKGAIIGGVIVDSCSWPEGLRARYFYSDYVRGEIFSLALNGDRSGVDGQAELLANTENGEGPVYFAVGPDEALYYAALSDGAIRRIQPKNPGEACPPPNTGGDGDAAGNDGGTSQPGDGDGSTHPGDGDGSTHPGDGDSTTNPGDGDGDSTGDGSNASGDGDGSGDKGKGSSGGCSVAHSSVAWSGLWLAASLGLFLTRRRFSSRRGSPAARAATPRRDG